MKDHSLAQSLKSSVRRAASAKSPNYPRAIARDAATFVDFQLEIQDRIADAAATLRLLPRETEKHWLASAERSSWPMYVRDWHAYAAEKARAPRIPPEPSRIDRMYRVLDWICWLAIKHPDEAKVIWFSFGCRSKTGQLARTLHVSRETIRRWRKAGIGRLVEHIQG